MLKVTIGIFDAPDPGAKIPSLDLEKDLWLPLKKVQKRIGGLAALDPLETVAPGSKGRRAFIQYDDSDHGISIQFDGESEIVCDLVCKISSRWFKAHLSLDAAKGLFAILDSGLSPISFLKEHAESVEEFEGR
jgi:hypothetical protein